MHKATYADAETYFPPENSGWNDFVRKDATDPADLMMRREGDAMIRQALNLLPPATRTAVELSDIEQLPCERIGEIMACPTEIVRSRIERGHTLIKQTIEKADARTDKGY